jgi:hypothetical protein
MYRITQGGTVIALQMTFVGAVDKVFADYLSTCLDFWIVAMRADNFILAAVIVHMIG